MDKLERGFLAFLAILAMLALIAVIPGWSFLVIKFAPIWIPFVESHLILKIIVISAGIAGGTMLLVQLVNFGVSVWKNKGEQS